VSLPEGWFFNETVMQIFIESLFIFEEACLGSQENYASVVTSLLSARGFVISLKASILR